MAASHRIQLGPEVDDRDTSIERFGLPPIGVQPPFPTGGMDEGAPADEAPHDVEGAAVYHAQRPEPSYSQFKPEFVDSSGREYAVARDGDFLKQQDGLANSAYTDPPVDRPRQTGRLLLWLRIPINLRHTVDPPSPEGEALTLYHPERQVACETRTENVFVQPRMSTGHMIVREFVSNGKVADPTEYESWFKDRARDPGAVWF